jgi:hypothetical protein
MKLSEAFGVNKDLEINGVWFVFKGMEFLIARLGNPKFKALYRKGLEANQVQVQFGGEEDHSELYMDCVSKAVLLDWKGVDGEDGKPMPYSPAEGLKAMKAEQLFYEFVIASSNRLDIYKTQTLDRTEKNSRKP